MRAPTTDAFGMGVGGRKRWHGRARFTKGLDCGVPHGLRVSVRRFARNRSLGSRLLLSRLIRGAEKVLTGSKPEWWLLQNGLRQSAPRDEQPCVLLAVVCPTLQRTAA